MIRAIVLLTCLAMSGVAQAVEPPVLLRGSVRSSAEERLRARHLAALFDTKVTLSIDPGTVREAFAALARQLPAPLVVRYATDPVGHGIDGTRLTVIDLVDQPAGVALELILAAAALQGDPCAWQLRKGFIEAGTKERLNAPAAHVRRTYHIRDLLLEIPEDLRYGETTRPEVSACLLVERVVTNVEPGTWDYGQDPAVTEPDDGLDELLRAAFGDEDVNQDPDAPNARPPAPPVTGPGAPRRYVPPRYPARIRYWRDIIVVDAPPYYHRQISGLEAAPKAPASPEAPAEATP